MKKRLDQFLNTDNVEQSLTSNSTINVPSIATVKAAINTSVVFGYVGNRSDNNFARLPFGSNNKQTNSTGVAYNYYGNDFDYNTINGSLVSNTFTDNTRNNTFGTGMSQNIFGPQITSNVFGSSFVSNKIDLIFYRNQVGDSCSNNKFGITVGDCIFGNAMTDCTIGANTTNIQMGDNCTRVTVIGCKGTSTEKFVIPAGEKDCTYLNNKKVVANAVTIEQDLTSNSITSVPSIAAVKTAVSAIPVYTEKVFVTLVDGRTGIQLDSTHFNKALVFTGGNSANSSSVTLPPVTVADVGKRIAVSVYSSTARAAISPVSYAFGVTICYGQYAEFTVVKTSSTYDWIAVSHDSGGYTLSTNISPGLEINSLQSVTIKPINYTVDKTYLLTQSDQGCFLKLKEKANGAITVLLPDYYFASGAYSPGTYFRVSQEGATSPITLAAANSNAFITAAAGVSLSTSKQYDTLHFIYMGGSTGEYRVIGNSNSGASSGSSVTIEQNLSSNSTANVPSVAAVKSVTDIKVDKVSGKDLSSNDYTSAEKAKLAGLSTQNNAVPLAGTDVNFPVTGKVSFSGGTTEYEDLSAGGYIQITASDGLEVRFKDDQDDGHFARKIAFLREGISYTGYLELGKINTQALLRLTCSDNSTLLVNGKELSSGSVTIEQNLNSNSTTSVPSVAAVKAAYNVVNNNSWFSSTTFNSLAPTTSSPTSTTVINPAVINFIPPYSQYRIDLNTTTANLNYNLTHDNTVSTAAGAVQSTIIDFMNGTNLEGKTRIVIYPGDFITFIRDANKNCSIIQTGNSKVVRGVVTVATKNLVKAGSYVNGELQGNQPTDSVPNMKFSDTNYKYEYALSAADTTGDTFVWTRSAKI